MDELFGPNDCNGEFASLKGSFEAAVTNTRNWPVAEIVIGEISDRLPSFDSLSECQLRS